MLYYIVSSTIPQPTHAGIFAARTARGGDEEVRDLPERDEAPEEGAGAGAAEAQGASKSWVYILM